MSAVQRLGIWLAQKWEISLVECWAFRFVHSSFQHDYTYLKFPKVWVIFSALFLFFKIEMVFWKVLVHLWIWHSCDQLSWTNKVIVILKLSTTQNITLLLRYYPYNVHTYISFAIGCPFFILFWIHFSCASF